MSGKRLVIVPGIYPATGIRDTAAKAARYAHTARRLGLEVEIIGGDAQLKGESWQTSVDPDGLTVTRVSPGNVATTRRLLWEALLARGPFDGVIVSSLAHVGQPAVMAGKHWKVPILAHVSGSDVLVDLYDPLWATFVGWALSQATRVTAASQEMADLARPFCANNRVDVWPDPVSLEQFYPQAPLEGGGQDGGVPPSTLRIGTLGPPQESTGFQEILTAFSQVRRARADAQLVLMGHPATTQASEFLETWRQKDPLSAGRMAVIPEPDEQGLPAYFGMLDQLWLPWRRDGFGSALIQAMACEVPVIATPVGAQSTYLRDGENALVIPVRHPDALASAALRYAGDPAWAKRVGATARRTLPASVHPAEEERRLARSFTDLGWLS